MISIQIDKAKCSFLELDQLEANNWIIQKKGD